MSNPQVTITLGRSGQKVVKRPQAKSNGAAWTGSRLLLGSKRRFESNAGASTNKRLRGTVISRSGDMPVGQNDLRFKLMRKRSRLIRREVEDIKTMESRERVSRRIRAPERPESRRLERHIPQTKRGGGLLVMEPFRSYTSWNSAGSKPESTDRVLQTSRRASPQRYIDGFMGGSSRRRIDTLGNGGPVGSDVMDSSRSNVPATATMRGTLDVHKPVKEVLPASGVPKSFYLNDRPLTVSSLLHSLGLAKYAVQFQAEETFNVYKVDMAALKQMRDCDLKELGIPMGPRKKILLAILPSPRK
ncbi:hypothetical protein RJ640_029890 [Escallonia rubra]|uniref:SAM domain-containing protein n=1 Tax=Escallonia rubra TaxID=112253 RepID=A0AA88QKF1_9ASTE|nr:hypothetical protein RJ640_029890 [Escallonia rubra]